MKTLVFLLVLGNLLFYTLTAGYFGRPDNPDAARTEHQIAPERIRVVSRGEAPALKAPEAPAEPLAPACLRWTGLDRETADRLETLLRQKHPGYKLARQGVSGDSKGWWVYIPPLASRAEADRKAGELRQLGVGDYFVLPESNPNRHGISLGIFSSERGAQERLNELKTKGVRSAKLAPRPGQESSFNLEARGPLPEKDVLLTAVSGDFPALTAEGCK